VQVAIGLVRIHDVYVAKTMDISANPAVHTQWALDLQPVCAAAADPKAQPGTTLHALAPIQDAASRRLGPMTTATAPYRKLPPVSNTSGREMEGALLVATA
jgi:hypothetical protein